MSWISQNKFIAGFSAAMVLGAGVLGYLTYTAKGQSNTAGEDYESALGKLRDLQRNHPYPDIDNRKKLEGQKTEFQKKITAFQKKLTESTLPDEPLSPTEFQDKLKETVARVTAKAAGDAHLDLQNKSGERFYMGFPEYASKSPKESLVPQLSRELSAFESIINLMLAAKDVVLIELKREEPKSAAKAERKLVHHSNFTLKFTSSDFHFRNILNGIVGNKEHFFIVRRITVENSKPQAPPKNDTAPKTPAPPSNAPGTPGSPAPTNPQPSPDTQQRLEYIFGTERVDATLEIELVDFAKPETPPTKPEPQQKEAK